MFHGVTAFYLMRLLENEGELDAGDGVSSTKLNAIIINIVINTINQHHHIFMVNKTTFGAQHLAQHHMASRY